MKPNARNSFALPIPASSMAVHGGYRDGIQQCGARVLEAMGQLENLATLRKQKQFEKLVNQNLDATTRVALRLTNDPDLAEDLVQETMLRAARHWDAFREQAQFKTWLYRILINAFRDQIRRAPKVETVDIQPLACSTTDATAEETAEVKELGQIVAGLIAKLPERQREVLVLSTYESFSQEQIAKTLHITVANVYANLSTARRKLKQQLSQYLAND